MFSQTMIESKIAAVLCTPLRGKKQERRARKRLAALMRRRPMGLRPDRLSAALAEALQASGGALAVHPQGLSALATSIGNLPAE